MKPGHSGGGITNHLHAREQRQLFGLVLNQMLDVSLKPFRDCQKLSAWPKLYLSTLHTNANLIG
jgi:hypothetical protein